MRLTRRAIALIMVIGASSGLVACGGGGDDDEPEDANTSLDITFEVDKDCVHPGDRQKLAMTTAPRTNVAYSIVYADAVARGEPPRGDTDGDGNFEASWTIPSDAPPGTVRVTILAAREARTGSTEARFTVQRKETPCA